jgi:hypothetical protein
VSVWRAFDKLRGHSPHRAYSVQEITIFAAGLLAAALFGVVCSGVLPG